jgi:hypothetical protein
MPTRVEVNKIKAFEEQILQKTAGVEQTEFVFDILS